MNTGKTKEVEANDATASELKRLLYRAAEIIEERQDRWRSFFAEHGIDLDEYSVAINSNHKEVLPEPPEGIDVYFTEYVPEGEIILMKKGIKHPLKGDIAPFR